MCNTVGNSGMHMYNNNNIYAFGCNEVIMCDDCTSEWLL